jgi:glycosyltransferase involved in cell wall biosynthesis/peptidoglycan/xylan/chitin deacetylase (PgdA/CDA1 family)
VRPARILFLIDELETWGGAERHLYNLCRALDPRRFEPEIAVLGRTRQVERFRAGGLSVLPLGVTRIYGASGLRAIGALAARMVARDVRLVVSYHTAADLAAPLAALPAGAVALSSRRDLGFTKKPSHVRAQRAVNHLVAGVIAVAGAVRRAVAASEGYPESRIHVIYNGVDPARYAPRPSSLRAELGVGEDEVLIGTLANFDAIKGYDVLVPAVETVLARTRARVVFFGDGPLLEEVRRRVAPLGGRVLLPGSRKDVEAALWAMDVFVLASHSEGFSNALLEAMAAGRAVCATSVGGNPELIDAGTGVLVPPGDPPALAAALGALCEDAPRRRALGAAARARIKRGFTFDVMVRRYEDLFEAAVEEAPGRAAKRAAKRLVAGAYAAAGPLVRRARPAAALALCYHRVCENPGGWDPALVVSAGTLRRQLEALGRSYDFVTCADLGAALAAGLRRRLCAISFDDGYADNLALGLPVLRAVGAPATLFVATDAIDGGRALWFERVAALLAAHAGDPRLAALGAADPELRDLGAALAAAPTPRAAVRRGVAAVKAEGTATRERIEELLVAGLGAPDPAALPAFLDWDGVRALRAAGVEIGGHTATHPILPRTEPARARAEIALGQARLMAELGRAPTSFAYPNGDHDDATVALVGAAGFTHAFTVSERPWDGDPLRVPRRCVAEQASRGYAGGFDEAAFLAEVEGAYDLVRGR